jgi:chromate transporter
MLLIIALGALYVRYGQFAWAQGILSGLTPAAAGLIVAVAARIAEPMIRRAQLVPILIGLVIFIAIGVLRLPLLAVLAVAIPISIAFTAWRRP